MSKSKPATKKLFGRPVQGIQGRNRQNNSSALSTLLCQRINWQHSARTSMFSPKNSFLSSAKEFSLQKTLHFHEKALNPVILKFHHGFFLQSFRQSRCQVPLVKKLRYKPSHCQVWETFNKDVKLILKRRPLKNKPSLSRYIATKLKNWRGPTRKSCQNNKIDGKSNWNFKCVPLKYTKPWLTYTCTLSKPLRSPDRPEWTKVDRVPQKGGFQLKGNPKTPFPKKFNLRPSHRQCLRKRGSKKSRLNPAMNKKARRKFSRSKDQRGKRSLV
jgi:hypothetical protein